MVRFVSVLMAALALVTGIAVTAQADGIVVPAVDTDWPGKIFVAHDEWALTDFAFQKTPNDSRALILNVAAWFTGGQPGRFLAYSTNKAYQSPMLAQTLRGAGHSWTVSMSAPFSLQTLAQYDAVFVGGDEVDNSVLIDYVRAGGSVYLVGGTGLGGVWEASHWNPFLNAFGLNMVREYDVSRAQGVWPVVSDSPLFAGVSSLYEAVGNPLTRLDPNDLSTQIIVWTDQARGWASYATYQTRAIPVPVKICPSKVKVTSTGHLHVWIAGTASFDVRSVDLASLELYGARIIESKYEHKTAADNVQLLGLTTLPSCSGKDATLDLVVGFDRRTVVQGVERALGRPLRKYERVALTLVGRLKPEYGSDPILGETIIEVDR